MNKKLLIALLPALLASGAANAAKIYETEDGSYINLYARMQGDFKFQDENKSATGESKYLGSTNSRFGLNGSQTINENASLIGLLQYQLVPNDDDASIDWQVRYAWAGVDFHDYGRIETGRVLSGVTLFSDIGDIFSTGGDPVAGAHAGTVDSSSALIFRQNGTLQYRNELGDLEVATAFIANTSVKSGYNFAARYNIDMGKLGSLQPSAMFQNTSADESSDHFLDTGVSNYQTYGVGARYFLGGLYAGASYAQEKMQLTSASDAITDGADFRLAYDFGDWVVRAGYRYLKFEGQDRKVEDAIQTEVQYRLTTQSSLFLNYTDNKGYQSTVNASGVTMAAKEKGAELTASLRYEF
ncbi:porin [Psychromonas ossibalaenae]|uniref:porin n=1 Tax=Psychromonas ossibalaenae TaxID=444922 RepID=UPI0003759D69|nr:porin [Psychromonas ossibalaenae]